MNKVRFLAVFSFSFLMLACSSEPAVVVNKATVEDPLFAFNDFPDSLFCGIYFNQDIKAAKENLMSNDFVLIDSSGALNYENTNDSTNIILPVAAKINSLKIILKSKKYLQNSGELMQIFSSSAVRSMAGADFSIYEYKTVLHSFKLTVFNQNDFIRLNFERRISK